MASPRKRKKHRPRGSPRGEGPNAPSASGTPDAKRNKYQQYPGGNVERALAVFLRKELPSLRQAAQQFGVPRVTVQDRLRILRAGFPDPADDLAAADSIDPDLPAGQTRPLAAAGVRVSPKLGAPTVLSQEEEAGIVAKISRCWKAGLSIGRVQVGMVVMQLLASSPRDFRGKAAWAAAGQPSRKWFKQFEKRHPEISRLRIAELHGRCMA
jgi:hypothetical protein